MARDRSQLRDEVIANHGGITGKDTLIYTLINSVVTDLTTNHRWRALQVVDSSQTLAADANTITVPTTIQHIDRVRLKDSDDNWYEIELLPLADFRNLEDGSGYPEPEDTSALPTHAHMIAGVMTFNYNADEAYTVFIDGYSYPTAMTTDNDEPGFSEVADDLIIAYVTGWLYQHRKQPQTAGVWFSMADVFFKTITNEDHAVKFQFTRKRVGI
jgi:hypothetical protein